MIILIDSYYPYAKGEPFLHGELIEASRMGERIAIYPLNCGDIVEGDLPDGIEFRKLNYNSITEKVLSCFTIFGDASFWDDILSCVKHQFGIKKLAAAIFYHHKIHYLYKQIYKDIKYLKPESENVCIYSYWMHIHACIAAKLKRKLRNAVFVTRAHGYDLYEFRASSGFLPGRETIFKCADGIFPVSKAGEEYLKEKYPEIDSSKISVSYLGTHDHGLNPADGTGFRIVSCSNAVSVKRIHLIIDALSQIKDLNIEWTHYGDGPLLLELKERAQNQLGDNISFRFEGFVQNEELLKKYSQQHITFFVNVSESEGLPVSIMEIMSFGIPAIATNVGGTSEIVSDGRNGFLLDKDVSSSQLSDMLRYCFCLDELKYKALRKEARATWDSKFNARNNYLKFYSAISEKVKNNARISNQ